MDANAPLSDGFLPPPRISLRIRHNVVNRPPPPHGAPGDLLSLRSQYLAHAKTADGINEKSVFFPSMPLLAHSTQHVHLNTSSARLECILEPGTTDISEGNAWP